MSAPDPDPEEQAETEGPQNVCQVEEEPQEQSDVLSIARTVVQRRGGYECEFVQLPPGYFQTDCSVCLLVLRDAHLATCCGHNFCKECIGRVQKAGNSCPLCNKEEFTLTYNREKDVALKQFEVYCTHHKIGCEWKGRLEMLDKHLNVDPELEKQLEGCAFVELQCWHDGCGQSFQRRLIAKHQSRECLQRPFSCEHCHEYESTYHDVACIHWPLCECYPVSCPHKCTQNTFQRQTLQKHLNEECPLQEVECEFKYTGCETKLPRKDMPEHLKENVGHMLLLARQNQELMAKLLEKDEQIRRMAEESQRELETKIEILAKDQQKKLDGLKLEKDEQIRRMAEENQRLAKDQQEKLVQTKEDIVTLKREKNEQVERLAGEYQRSTKGIRQKMKAIEERVVPKAAMVKLEGRVMELQQRSETDHVKVERRVAEIENTSATSVTEVKRRITKLENNKASKVEVKRYQDRVLTVERGAITKAEREELINQVVTRRELEDRIGGLERKQDTIKDSLEKLSHLLTAPIQIVMTNFERHKWDKDFWYSEGFYTKPQGYKMCLRVDANGVGDGKGTHVTCSVYLMRGEFDNHLKWPFRGNVTVQLLNQREDLQHRTETVHFVDETPDRLSVRVTSGERAGGKGYHKFIPHSELGYTAATNCQYLMKGSLYFRVKVELL